MAAEPVMVTTRGRRAAGLAKAVDLWTFSWS